MRCGLYIRVSTDGQVERGESLEVQLKKLNGYVDTKEHWQVVEVYQDKGVSAKNINRPEFCRMQLDIEAGKLDIILCTKLDRLFRNTKDFLLTTEYFEKHNVGLVCIEGNIDPTTPSGRVFSTMKAAFAQFERETTAERVREVMHVRAEEGKYNGGPTPFGYRHKNKKLVVDVIEAEIVKRIFNRYLERRAILSVAHELNNTGVRTRDGELWTPQSVRRILTSPVYYGYTEYNKRSHDHRGHLKHNPKEKWIVAKGLHSRLISKELFDEVQGVIKEEGRLPSDRRTHYLLSGLVYCSLCGSKMHGQRTNGQYTYYKCSGHAQKGNVKCSGMAIRVDALDSSVVNHLKALSLDYTRFEEVLRETIDENNDSVGSVEKRLKSLEARIREIKAKKERIFDLFEDAGISKSQFLERKSLLDAEESTFEKELSVLKDKLACSPFESYDADKTFQRCQNMKEVFDELEIVDRRELVRSLLTEVKVDKHSVAYAVQVLPKTVVPTKGSVFCAESNDTGRGSWPPKA